MGMKAGNHKLSFVFTSMALAGMAACQSEGADEQAELEALLRDDPLTQVPPGAAAIDGIHADFVPETADPLGVWDFDDCSPFQTDLSDTSFHNHTAFRSIDVACVGGIQGLGVAIAAPEDIVYVPDQPTFRFENGVTVAGWFAPGATGGTQTLFRKRDRGTSSFALLLHGQRFELVLSLGVGRAIQLTSPARAHVGVFQHVAASYDGSTARLFVDGIEVNSLAVSGTIPPGAGPLLIGNDGSERRFSGTIDNAMFATHALAAADMLALTCLPQRPNMVVTPTELITAPGQSVAIDVALTNQNPQVCPPIRFSLMTFDPGEQLVIAPFPLNAMTGAPVPSGATGHMAIRATPSLSIEGTAELDVGFLVEEPISKFHQFGNTHVTVAEPTGCHASIGRELMITRPSVVDDPIRAAFDRGSSDPRNGVWTFKHLIENIAPTPQDAPAMVEAMLTGFVTGQTINMSSLVRRGHAVGLSHRHHVPDPVTGQPRTFNDLGRRAADLQAIVCADPHATGSGRPTLRKGIQRVH
jgi:hypothetical protein